MFPKAKIVLPFMRRHDDFQWSCLLDEKKWEESFTVHFVDAIRPGTMSLLEIDLSAYQNSNFVLELHTVMYPPFS